MDGQRAGSGHVRRSGENNMMNMMMMEVRS